MEINYRKYFPLALKALYPDKDKRNEIERKLAAYGKESFHREPNRVKLGVLYLTSQEPAEFESILSLACTDYRDLLCAAEYPYSSKKPGLRDKNPEEYKKLKQKERNEYLAWIEKITRAQSATYSYLP